MMTAVAALVLVGCGDGPPDGQAPVAEPPLPHLPADEPDYDGDGLPDRIDRYPFGADLPDTDGDSLRDVYDPFPRGEDRIDANQNNVPGISEAPVDGGSLSVTVQPKPPDYDNDGIADNDDSVPSGVDLIDTDGDDVVDADDVEPYTDLEPLETFGREIIPAVADL